MKIYLSAAFGRRAEIAWYAQELRQRGHTVTSTWHDGAEFKEPNGDSPKEIEMRGNRAAECYEEIADSGAFVAFTESPGSPFSSGGRHAEFGAAMTLVARLVVVGFRENHFHCLGDVKFYPTWAEFLATMPAKVVP